MYTKEQASLVKESFWRSLGQKMQSQLSEEGLPIKWINYETGIRHLSFKMDADRHMAIIKVEITHPDADIHELLYAQFIEVKPLFETYVGNDWVWKYKQKVDSRKDVSSIYDVIEGVNIFRPSDQPIIYKFLRERLILLDRFWCHVNPAFELFKD